tara:strand:+ start:193 stop:612 length:420 start_codon:yes stop_codon:yes gene_type:complete
VTRKYIFRGDASEIFYSKLNDLHDKYVIHLLLNGHAPIGTHIESIKMTKNPSVSQKYCEKAVGGLVNIKPQVIAKLSEEEDISIECIFTKVTPIEALYSTFNHLFMIQNVINYPKVDNFNCQIWYLGETSVKEIEKHWL